MNFWTTVLAVIVGITIWDIFVAFVKAVIDRIREKNSARNERKIGFDGAKYGVKTAKETTMRKIGFGAND